MSLIPPDVRRKFIGYSLLAALAAVVTVVIVFWAIVVLVFTVACWTLAAAAAIQFARLLVWFARLSRPARAHVPAAVWAWLWWPHLCRQLGLAVTDRQAADAGVRKARHPRTRIRPAAHGLTVHLRTVPGVGRKELEDVADHLANHWGAQRVAIAQPAPGRLVVRAMRRDPLLVPFSAAQAPSEAYTGCDLTRLYAGRDEHGEHRWMTVKDNTAATMAGQPGSGKSVGVNGWLLQWAPNPAVQWGTADGKSPVDGGDYEVWRPRAWRTCSDSREDTADMLSDAVKIMRERLGRVVELTGSRNAWHQGPTVDFPLFGLVLDECQRYLDATAYKPSDPEYKLIRQIQQMAEDIVRQGRSVLMFLVLATQRATVDSIKGQIRDNAALSLALSQKTTDASVAALGSSIREYPSFMPTTLQGSEFTGCAIASMRTGLDPFTRLRMPEVTHAELQAAADATAHLRRDPATLLPVAVPDDVSALVP